jgi:superfamily II DNA or RNA helicase
MTSLDPSEVFDGKAKLHLLQLLARRNMAERLQRSPEPQDLKGQVADAIHAVPARWQLLPQETALYDWQKECLPLWLKAGRGTVKVATGGGKTVFALAAGQALQNESEHDLRLVVVVPSIPMMFQWRDELLRGNLPSSAIGLMGGDQETPRIDQLRILICVLNSARDKLPAFVTHGGWPSRMLLVVDECHRSAAEQARRIFESNPRYTLGLSATPEPGLEDENVPTDDAYNNGVAGKALGRIIYDFSLQDCLKAGLLTPFEVWHIGLPLSASESSRHVSLSRQITELRRPLQSIHARSRSRQSFLAWCQTQASRGGTAGMDASRFIGLANQRKRLLYHADSRFEACLGILADGMRDEQTRAIVFHESIEEIESLFLQALERGLPAVLEHSKLPDGLRAESIEAFRRGVARVIISAKSLIEGFNVPSADLGVIAASSGSVRQRIQSLGRMLRRKPGGRNARVYVLYISDSEDESIYEKADWENVIGAERNRYFRWRPASLPAAWPEGLEETDQAPRLYRPPAWDVDVTKLALGDPYPGQPHGREVRVDQAENLRLEDETIVPASRDLVSAMLDHNSSRWGRITPPGHLIVRSGTRGLPEEEWRFLGIVRVPDVQENASTKLRIMTVSGRRVIARESSSKSRAIPFALGPGKSSRPEAGEARDCLLAWIATEESRIGMQIRDLYWDGSSYWLEVKGERIPYPGSPVPLEFES